MRNSPSEIIAVLGPTNTGKTHDAIEHMLKSSSGILGLPLRLLAREVYEKVIERVGAARVALVTGEEKLIPTNPKYWICTVEAMPSQIKTAFVGVDEIQLCADKERGHVFTDRLLNWRGTKKTMFLGSETVRGVLAKLVPDIRFETKTRFSTLSYAGYKKVPKLPSRSAIVAFSADSVYSLAELVRRQRGGAAVIMGSLSPRTRNAQVALYQSGEVDYLVATDAIGMGLNMDIDHVAFSSLRKFDGVLRRDLTLAEMGQIAGRAGRYCNDGSFGLSGKTRELDITAVEALQNHSFDSVNTLQWRNRNLNFSSIERLKSSLMANPNRPELARARFGADISALDILSVDEEIKGCISNQNNVELLWSVCQLPDYRNISAHDHAGIVAHIFKYLIGSLGVIDEDWFARQLAHCDNIIGDIDTISNRISHIRTWTFVANRSGWLNDGVGWRQQARNIEDKLSDALHEALIQRFIDRRTSLLMQKLRQRKEVMSSVEENGAVMVEGQEIGQIQGFRFISDLVDKATVSEIKSEAIKIVRQEMGARATALIAVPDPDLNLTSDGKVMWQGAEIASLSAGDLTLKPQVILLADDYLETSDKEAIEFRLQKFLERNIAGLLAPLINISDDENLDGLAKGVGFRLVENLGILARSEVAADIKSLDQSARSSLRKHGIRFGAFHIFVPVLLKPAATQLRLLLWALREEKANGLDRTHLPQIPGQGLTSAALDPASQKGLAQDKKAGFFLTAGFKVCGSQIVRVDMLERLGDMIRERVFWRPVSELQQRPEGSVEGGGFTIVPDMMSLVGCSGEVFAGILTALNFKAETRALPVPVQTSNSEVAEPAVETGSEPNGDSSKIAQKEIDAVNEVDEPSAVQEDSGKDALEEVATTYEVWWPKDTGPFRAKRPAGKSRNYSNKNKGDGKNKDDGAKPSKYKGKNKKPARSSKAVNKSKSIRVEDSPFAALAALKNSLKK